MKLQGRGRCMSCSRRIHAKCVVTFAATLFSAGALLLSDHSAAADPSYTYTATLNGDTDVCRHMSRVFNSQFKDLWQGEALGLGEDPNYSAKSRYAFPRLSGVEHSTRMTFDMRSSKVPSSPEFDAIPWQEARGFYDSPASGMMPVLIAYVDFDNDGQIDTVLKNGFVVGYSFVITSGASDEYLTVWRAKRLEVSGPLNLSDLIARPVGAARPLSIGGTYIRPFVYNSHVYVARYNVDESLTNESEPKESMSVESYAFTGELDEITKGPKWTATQVCSFGMNQIKKSQ